MDDDFVYLYIDSSQKLKIYILDNLESQLVNQVLKARKICVLPREVLEI